MRPSAFYFTAYLLALAPTTPASAQAAAAPDPAAVQLAQATTSAATRTLGQKIGVAGAVRGEVRVTPHDSAAVGIVAKSGDPIRLGDKVQSGPNAGLQIMLLDETVFSIGPDAEMTVDEFVFDPSTDAGSVAASIGKGAFRFITGRVATKDPQRMNVRLPQATIGIRGTIVAGIASSTTSEVVLLGPGPDNNAREKVGAITVANANGNVAIARAGFATTVAGQGAPTTPVLLSPERVRAITQQSNASTAPRVVPATATTGQQQAAAPRSANGDSPGTPGPGPGTAQAQGAPPPPPPLPPLQAAPDAGMQLVGAQTVVQQLGGILAPPPALQQLATQAAQQTQAQLTTQTNFDQLRSLTGPTAIIALNPISLVPISGTGSGFFGFSAAVDFGNRDIAFQVNANYTLGATPYSGPVYAELKNYATDPGSVSTTLSSMVVGQVANFHPAFLGTTHQATITVDVRNNTTSGRIADTMKVGLTVTNGANTLTGAGTQVRP